MARVVPWTALSVGAASELCRQRDSGGACGGTQYRWRRCREIGLQAVDGIGRLCVYGTRETRCVYRDGCRWCYRERAASQPALRFQRRRAGEGIFPGSAKDLLIALDLRHSLAQVQEAELNVVSD